MKRTDFSRSVITSTIKVAAVKIVDGNVETKELAPIVHVGTSAVKDEKAKKLARATYKAEPTIVVLGIDIKEEVRGMDFETFMKYSIPVERPASQQKPKDKEVTSK
nr:MAG TPA: Histone-like Protein p6 [Caudoviricetes sp.]